MSDSRTYIFVLWLLFCVVSYQNASGFQIGLTREQGGDYFNNPHRGCDDGDAKSFCLSTNSVCSTGRSKCCYCECRHAMDTTFNVTNLRCASDLAFRQGCKVKFTDKNLIPPIKLLDLTTKDEAKIYWHSWPDDVNSFSILSIDSVSYHGGREINFLKEKRKGKGDEKEKPKKKKDGFWEAKIQWDYLNFHVYGAKVFRVNISYEIEENDKSLVNRYDCFIFKSKGSISVTFPTLPSTAPSPSTTEKTTTTRKSTTSATQKSTSTTQKSTSTTQKSTSTTQKSTSTTQKSTTSTTQKSTSTSISPSSMVPSTTDEILTTAPSPRKTPNNNTRPTRNTPRTRKPTDPEHAFTSEISSSSIAAELVPENERQSSENEENKMVYIIVSVVVVVIVIALAIVVRFTMIRKKKKMLKKRESKANIIMSDINKNNINEDEDEFYTTLDKSTRNGESNYQALTLPGATKNQSIVNAYNEKICQIEGNYIYLDADNVYSTIDPQINVRKVGAKSNDAFDANEDERVYSILEQYPKQIDYTTPSTEDERVYSNLKTVAGHIAYPTASATNGEPADQGYTVDTGSDYVTVLPPKIDYVTVLPPKIDYVTVLPPKIEPGQSDCSVYADLSEERADENEYQSLRKK